MGQRCSWCNRDFPSSRVMISVGIFPVYNYCSERCKSAHQNSLRRDKKVKEVNKTQREITKSQDLKQKIESEKLQVELEKVKLENKRIRLETLNVSYADKPKDFWYYARLSWIHLKSL